MAPPDPNGAPSEKPAAKVRETAERIRPPKSLIQRFRLSKRIGRGGMGTVYLGTHPETEAPCAVKIVQSLAKPQMKTRLDREAKVLAKVRHTNLVEIYDAGVSEDVPWIAMEAIEGRNLSQLRRKQDLREPRLLTRVLKGVGAALDALHEAGVLHRDVKLGNIMLDQGTRPVLMDLGLALDDDVTRLTRTGHLVGTITYLAPEVYFLEDFSKASDWYALGTCLYTLLEGKNPYTSEEVLHMAAHRDWRPPPPMQGPLKDHVLSQVALWMMEADPGRRLVGSPALLRALEEGAYQPPKPAKLPPQPQPAPPKPSPPKPRPEPPWGLLGFALGAMLSLGLVLNWVRSPAPPPSSIPPSPTAPRASIPRAAPSRPPPEASAEGLRAWSLEVLAAHQELSERPDRRPFQREIERQLSFLLTLPEVRRTWPAQAEFLFGLARDKAAGQVYPGWREQLETLLEAMRGDPATEKLARDFRPRLEELEALEESYLPRLPSFEGGSPPKDLLWALRTYSPEAIPPELLQVLVGLGKSLPESFDLEAWAADLREHPLVSTVRAQREGWIDAWPPPRLGSLELGPGIRPPPGASVWVWRLWWDSIRARLTRVRGLPRDKVNSARKTWVEDFRRELQGSELPSPVRDLFATWVPLAEAVYGQPPGQIWRAPLASAKRKLAALPAALGESSLDPTLKALLGVDLGWVEALRLASGLECDRLEVQLRRIRADAPPEPLVKAGLGPYLEAQSLGPAQTRHPLADACREARLSQGTPNPRLRFLEGSP